MAGLQGAAGIDENTQYTKGINGDTGFSQSANKYLNPAQHFAHTTNMVEDMFSGQDVSAPAPGAWGQEGTAASGYNQAREGQGASGLNYQIAQGNQAQQRAQGLGQGAYGVGFSNSSNSLDQAQAAQGRNAPQSDWGQANQSIAGAQRTVSALDNFAANQGNGPSAAQAAANNVNNQGMAQNLALARSGHGFGGNAAAMGQAQAGQAQITANAANQAQQIRANEYQQAQQNRLNALNSSLGGTLAISGQQAGQNQFDVGTQLQQRGMNDAYSNANNQNALNWYSTGAGLQQGYEQQGQQGALAHQQLGFQNQLGQQQLGQNALNAQSDYELQQQQMRLDADKANQNADTQRDSANTSMFSSFLGAMSDERVKKLKQRESALSDALSTLGNAPGYSYKYKDTSMPGTAPGTQVSSMAQDLEKGPLGQRIVSETPNGKMVNYEEVIKMTPGAITELNQKVRALEKALGRTAA
jgi:hypothetical protein